MEFTSVFFIIFFLPVSVIIYYLTPARYKPAVLLAISSAYCAMISVYLLVLVYILIVLNYFLAMNINKKSGRLIYFLSLSMNTVLLTALKTKPVLSLVMPVYSQNVFLPVCISFFMLEFIGYITDIYRRKGIPEKNFLNFALYILFFPRFIMGAVVSYQDFYVFMKHSRINLSILGRGLIMFIKGLAKNVIIGNSLYPLWETVKNIQPEKLSALSALLGISAFTFSFYFCLSGILDMSAGISCCFGYKIPPDFDHPFFTSGLSDFLSRWHINTVKWFREYIFMPLEKISFTLASVIMWVLVGLWYELSWNKLIWGLITGLAVSAEKFTGRKNVIYTFIVSMLGWIFFSCSSPEASVMLIKSLFGMNHGFADSLSFYFLKSYIVILLIAIYTSTDLFKNLTEKIKDNHYLSVPFGIAMPFIDMILLVISIAIITSDGSHSLSSMFG